MLDPNIDNTQPAKITSEKTQPIAVPAAPKETNATAFEQVPAPGFSEELQPQAVDEPDTTPRKPLRRWPWVLGGILLILSLAAIGGFIGYRAALQMRSQANSAQITKMATEQFMLGLQEQAAGKFDIALKRFQYVISLDPSFPGAQAKLTEVMMALAMLQTPTVTMAASTPTLTPTPDTRAEEEIFTNARLLMNNKEWFKALDVLDALRNKNLTYRAVEVDGMYYTALRFRGLARINAGDLEGGLYDLALVERFAPLDVDANGVRTWARIYLTGAAYWGARWDQVVFYFSQVSPYFPGMRDSTGMTALERYRIALMKYGDQLSNAGKYCEAVDQYNASYQVGPDATLDATATAVYNLCHPPEPTQAPQTPTPTITPTLNAVLPTDTPAVILPTETPTETLVIPTETPTIAP
jgi:tetratricopeptide (TPR) repeat protein